MTFSGDHVTGWKGGEDLPSNLELLAEIDGDKGRKIAAVPVPAVPTVPASGVPPVTSVTAPAGQPSTQPDASNALAGDPNQQAAQAANRATDAVQAPTGRTRSSAFSNAPTTGNLPATIGGTANAQIQLQRRPDPALTTPNSSANGGGASVRKACRPCRQMRPARPRSTCRRRIRATSHADALKRTAIAPSLPEERPSGFAHRFNPWPRCPTSRLITRDMP